MIAEVNKKRLDGLEETLKNWLSSIAERKIDSISQTIDSVRALKQFMIGLAVAIIGVVFPALIGNNTLNTFYLVAFAGFFIITIWGLLSLITPIYKEAKSLPKIYDHHGEEVIKMVQRIQHIRTLDNNNEAGKEYEKLETAYAAMNLGTTGLIGHLFNKHTDWILYTLFITSFLLLALGMILEMTAKHLIIPMSSYFC